LTLQKRFDPSWLLVVLLTVFAIAPLTYPGFFEAHSGFLPVFNATHLSDAPNWGRVAEPVRGEGKLPYLLAWPFFKLSGSGVVAIKVMEAPLMDLDEFEARLMREKGVVPAQLQADLARLDRLGIPRDIIFEQGVDVLFGG
jgi:hypothetical protein